MKKEPRKVKRVRAYADIGSHGGIFHFIIGPVAERYPTLMHVYHKRVAKNLVPIIIEIPINKKI